jgi:murE/murF fusion protein
VSINTKTIKKNNLFFAIKGKNKDGHKYVKEAIKRGAIKAIVNNNTR